MRLFKEKLAWAAPIAVILIIALFSVNLFAQGNPKVKNLPVAFIVNDSGVHVDAVKAAVEQMSKGIDGEEPMLAFTNEKEEDIERLSVEEMDDIINEKFRRNEYAWNAEKKIKWETHGRICHRLEDFCYKCPKCGKEFTMKAYEEAVKEKYKFFSFGDAMIIY